MRLGVHRCRFVNWSPSPITALAVPPAVPPPPLPTPRPFPPLAVGRQNGSIELYQWSGSAQAWVLHATLPGPADTKVDALAFTLRAQRQPRGLSHLRLFSISGDANLFEWDLQSGTVLHTIPSQGGTIWSLAPNPTGTLLAIGCQDGAVRLLDISDPTHPPAHLRRFDRLQTRFLSIAWGSPTPDPPSAKNTRPGKQGSTSDSDTDADDGQDASADTTLVTGCSDSCLRTWDVRTGRVLDRMTVERARGERTLVWSVAVLGDGTIVSGDSLGTVKFWDAATATQIHSFPAHDADVLCMTVAPSGTAVYTAGVDQRTTEFVRLSEPPSLASTSENIPGRWVQTTARRIHSHDVRALAMWPPYSHSHTCDSGMYAPLLISGGLDMSVAVTPAAPSTQASASTASAQTSNSISPENPLQTSAATTFQDAFQRRLGHPVSAGAVVLAPHAKTLVSFSGRVVGVWRLPEWSGKISGTDELGMVSVSGPSTGDWEKALEMELRFRTNITAGAVSADGRWLAVADAWETKLFRIEEVKGTLRPRRSRSLTLVLSAALSESESSNPATGASTLAFTPDSRRLVLATWAGARVVLIDLDERAQEEVVRVFDVHWDRRDSAKSHERRKSTTSSADEDDADTINSPRVGRVAVSPDCQWLATSDSGGRVCIFNLDSVKYITDLPRTELAPSALAFDSRAPHVLALGYPNNTLQLFDAEARCFYPALPERLAHLHDPILGIVFPPGPGARRMYVWSATWLARFDVPTPSPAALLKRAQKPTTQKKAAVGPGLKRKRVDEDEAFGIVTKFRPVLLVDFCAPREGQEEGEGEMVVVERPLVDLLATLPPAFLKPTYGAS